MYKRQAFEPAAKPQRYLGDNEKSTLILLSDTAGARFRLTFGGHDSVRMPLIVDAAEFIGVKSSKARGKRLTPYTLQEVEEIEPREGVEAEAPEAPEADTTDAEETFEERSDEVIRDEINGQQRIELPSDEE